MTKILPHYNCLNGEHVFIPNRTMTNTRESWIESFVCTHCLVVVNKTQWEVHQQELERMAKGLSPIEIEAPKEPQPAPYIPHDYKALQTVELPTLPIKKPAPKQAPKKG